MKQRDYDFKNKVESILFSAGKKISFDEIMNLIRIRDKQGVEAALMGLQKDYDQRNAALMVVQEGDFWKMTVRERYLQIVQRIVADTELSKTVMETLAVIAWKQPILQSEVIAIRTNKAYDHIKELEEMGFLTTERSGRSRKIKLSEKFYDYFDVHDEKGLQKLFKGVNIDLVQGTKDDTADIEKELEALSMPEPMKKETSKPAADPTEQAAEIQAEAEMLGMSVQAQEMQAAAEQIEEPIEKKAKKRKSSKGLRR
jgi:segregation and condensation protein B